MTGACEKILGPGIAVYQQMTKAGRFCDLADLDDHLTALCKGATGEAQNRALWGADKKVLCALLCCCNAKPGSSASGRNAYQACVSQTLAAAQKTLGGDSRYKPEVSFNMNAFPPEPMMERGLLGGMTTTPIPWTRGGIGHMRNRMAQDYPDTPFTGATRRPDVVIVNDPSKPPTQDNIFKIVEMKFGPDTFTDQQRRAYNRIAGEADGVEELDAQKCECSDDNRTQEQFALVIAAQAVEDARISVADRALAAGGAILGALGTAVAIASPFEGPAGDITLGTLTAGMASRVFASSALSAAARQALARNAATSWARIFRSGAKAAY